MNTPIASALIVLLALSLESASGQFAQPVPVEEHAPPVRVERSDQIGSPPPMMLSGWETASDRLPLPIFDGAIASSDDHLVVTGGFTKDFKATPAIQIRHPREGWLPVGSQLRVGRARHTTTVLPDGRMLIVGGLTGVLGRNATATSSCEIVDPVVAGTQETAALDRPIAGHCAYSLADGRVAIVGDEWMQIFDPRTQSWSARIDWIKSRKGCASVLLSDKALLIIGGDAHGTIERVDLAATMPSPTVISAGLNRPLSHLEAVELPDGRVLIAGGFDRSKLRTIGHTWLFNPAEHTIIRGTELKVPRGAMSFAIFVNHNFALFFGGEWRQAGKRGEANLARLYDLESRRLWAVAALPNNAGRRLWRQLENGRIAMYGGYRFVEADPKSKQPAGSKIFNRSYTLSLDEIEHLGD